MVVDITDIGSKVEDMGMERPRRTFSKKKKQRHFLITIFSKNNAILTRRALLFEFLPKAIQIFVNSCYASKIIPVIGEKMRRTGLE